LVIVLWALTLLTVIAAGIAMTTRTETGLTVNQVARARLNASADAGIHRAIHEFTRLAPDPESAWKADGRTYEFDLEGAHVSLVALSETAFIDLNHAPDILLKGLMLASGASDAEAERLIAAVNDWRDSDDLTRDNGAEREQYEAAGSDYIPRNAPFQYVEELSLVLGMRPELYRAMAPALTVFSGKAGFDSRLAPRAALLAVPHATPEEVDAYLEQRAAARAEGRSAEPFPPAAAYADAGGMNEGVYNFASLARLEDGANLARRAIVRLTRDPNRPFLILDWKEVLPGSIK
jgi:general secretion pathway protein K